MAGPSKTTRVRAPLMAAFRQAYVHHDARARIDQRDESGERVLAGRRTAARAAMSETGLHRAVSTDLETLMNTINLGASLDLSEFPETRRSILNFGFPDVVHRSIDEIGVNDIGGEIQTALTAFEPRLVPASVRVVRDWDVDTVELKIRFVVRADLNCEPLNVPVEFVADLERDTGKITINRR